MALDRTLLAMTSAGLGQGWWRYRTADTAGNIAGAGYFNLAADLLKVGDIVLAITDTGTTAVVKIHGVISNNGTTVVMTAAA